MHEMYNILCNDDHELKGTGIKPERTLEVDISMTVHHIYK